MYFILMRISNVLNVFVVLDCCCTECWLSIAYETLWLVWNTKEKELERKKRHFRWSFLVYIFTYIHTYKKRLVLIIFYILYGFLIFSHFFHMIFSHISHSIQSFITYFEFIHLRYSNLTPFLCISTYIYLHFSCTSYTLVPIGTKLNLIT